MLEKNKDYVEFTLQCTTVERSRDKNYREVCFNGYSDYDFPGVPMDVVCKEFDHKVVVVGKREFERLQAENEQLKKKLHEFDPIPEFKELTEKLQSTEDVEELEWVLNHTCGGWGSVNGWRPIAQFWKKRYDDLLKLTGYKSERDIHAVLTLQEQFVYETMRELINSLRRKTEFTDSNWQNATGCLTPEAAKSRIEGLENAVRLTNKNMQKELEREIDAWQTATGCSTPEEAKEKYEVIMLDNMEASAKANEEWSRITGFSTPEKCSSYIDTLEKKLEDIKDLIEEV